MKTTTPTYDPKKGKTYRYAHIKRDGHYLNVVRGHAWTSHPHDIVDKLPPALRAQIYNMPEGFSFGGELWIPGGKASDIKTALASDGPNALRFDVFCIYSHQLFKGISLQTLTLKACKTAVENLGFSFIPWRDQPFNPAELMQISIQSRPSDVEGYVLKNGNLLDWAKLKPRPTIDLIVTGFVDGDGKYANQIGSIACSTTEGYEVANVSGMTDDQRRYMSENSGKILGSVIEVVYQNVGSQGRLRHPAFVRIRDDKLTEDCKASQDPELEAYWQKPSLF